MSPELLVRWIRAGLQVIGLIRGEVTECPKVAAARGKAAGEAANASSRMAGRKGVVSAVRR